MTQSDPSAKRPLVLVIDDDPAEEAFADAVRDRGVSAVFAQPEDVTADLLADATLIVLDQYLDDWPQRRARDLPPSLTVLDGLSLAGVLRAHTDRSSERQGRPARPVAFALRTGELDELAAGLPRGPREHLLASQVNLDWVFDKKAKAGNGLPSVAARAAVLAAAAGSLPREWGTGTGDPGLAWLALGSPSWGGVAAWQVEQCRPPQHAVAQRTTGTAWLRWFLHRVLPYPTFLLDRTHTAATLGITSAALDEVLAGEPTPFTEALDEVRYRGGAHGFAGDRWWRAGVGDLLDVLASGQAQHEDQRDGGLPDFGATGPCTWGQPEGETAALVSGLHGSPVEAFTVRQPVLVLDGNQDTRPEPVEAHDALRLQPDGWPPYADDPWAVLEDVTGDGDLAEALAALVVSTDRWTPPFEAAPRS